MVIVHQGGDMTVPAAGEQIALPMTGKQMGLIKGEADRDSSRYLTLYNLFSIDKQSPGCSFAYPTIVAKLAAASEFERTDGVAETSLAVMKYLEQMEVYVRATLATVAVILATGR